ncbi:MAG: aldehyde dehydrogenase family protein [Trebonia sp.]
MTVVTDPRTGRAERELTPPSQERLRAIVAGLRAAQPSWERSGAEARARALREWADAMEAASGELSAALTADTGRAYETALEVSAVIAAARRWAQAAPGLLAPQPGRSAAVPTVVLETGNRPYQVAGVISPWNFPLLLALIDAIPALAAGSAVLVKPSEVTPRFIAPLRATIAAVPALRDVVGVVEGAGETGAVMTGLVDVLCFTGSVATGRLVAEACARAFIPAFLELGGKDPAIVLPGADLERASSALLWGSVANAGQSCQSIERIYAHAEVYEELLRRLVAKAEQVTLALDGPGAGMLGPLVDPAQAQVIDEHLADARARGARVLTGGRIERHGGGWWVRPTVLADVDHTMAVMRDETFGPILPVMSAGSVDEAVALANDSRYGLSGAVFGPEAEAAEVARRLDVGAVSVNDAGLTAIIHEGEKNSFRASGLGGSRMGTASLFRFVRKQTLMINQSHGRDPWWHTP